jgi:F0F1-type ATP synthase epsilon subunit
LNALLADVSQRQRDQQEARVQRQLERAQSSSSSSSSTPGTNDDVDGIGAVAAAPFPPAAAAFYLNALLADVSQRQRDQQEARVQRQLERAQSLGALAWRV